MRYMVRPRVRRVSNSAMWEAILAAFEALPRVQFAYPTQRFFEHPTEGKPELAVPRRGSRSDAVG